jgi:DNA primase
MEDTNELILDLLGEFLGDPRKSYPSKNQYSFDCVECDDDRHKGNLEVNIGKSMYHCWACGISGSIYKLIDAYGNAKLKKQYELFKPDYWRPNILSPTNVELPENFRLFDEVSDLYPEKRKALEYLKGRGVTDSIIKKYKMGFCDYGSHSRMVVIPSYNAYKQLNYYVARSYVPNSRMKYKNPDAPKNEIIFNENLINWNTDIYLTEGVFDAMFLENSIPLLGKYVGDKLFEALYERSGGYIIIALDGDAFDAAKKIYHVLNGGRLFGRIKILKLPTDKDVADLRGNIEDYYFKIK